MGHCGGSSDMVAPRPPLCLCSPGIVPALFQEEEKESVFSQIGQEAARLGLGPAKESLWQYFVSKSANNLHIVLGMSPVGDTLRTRCRNFPGTPCKGSLHLAPHLWKQQGAHRGVLPGKQSRRQGLE